MLLRASALALTAVLVFAPVPALFAQDLPLAPALPQVGGQATAAQPVAADAAVSALVAALRVQDLLDVMRLEGLDYGKSLEEDLFPGQGGARWQAAVEHIYDAGRMQAGFEAVLLRELAQQPALIAPAQEFFSSERGKSILMLELEARRALLDPAVEDAAKVAFADMAEGNAPRFAQIKAFAAANDMIEANVIGALNANLSFYKGMAEGGALGEMTEPDMVAEVWGQEAQVRADTEEWLFPYLSLAYQPVSDPDLDAYIAFSQTPAGQHLNTALYAAFDALFLAISHDLGYAAARQITGQDI